MPVWVFYAEMPVSVKNFHLKLPADSSVRTKIMQAVNRNIFWFWIHLSTFLPANLNNEMEVENNIVRTLEMNFAV